MLHQVFVPKTKVYFDFLEGNRRFLCSFPILNASNGSQGGAISTFTFTHGTSTYIYLEDLEVHQLNRDIPLCSEPDVNDITTLYIEFVDYASFRSARTHWSDRSDLIFAAEDSSCVAGEGERSVYLASSLEFHGGYALHVSGREMMSIR